MLKKTLAAFKSKLRSNRKTRRRILNIESLERKQLLAAQIFVDFGDGFSGGVLNTSSSAWVTSAKGVDFSATTPNFSIQRFNDMATSAGISAPDISTIRSNALALIRSYYEPFNVTIVENSAASVSDIATKLNSASTNDTYLVVGKYYYSGGSLLNAYGVAPGTDAYYHTNSYEETASVFADNILSLLSAKTVAEKANGLAYTVTHESGHAFGLPHSANPPTSGASSDLMTQNAGIDQRIRTDNFFSNVTMNAVEGTTTTFNPYSILVSNVGARPVPSMVRSFVTGTGGDDLITISYASSLIRVDVAANAASGGIATTYYLNYYSLPGPYQPYTIQIQGGFGNDTIRFDSSLSALAGYQLTFAVSGATGTDTIEYYGTSAANTVTFTPSTISALGSIGNVTFGTTTENVDYYTNGGDDIVYSQFGAYNQFTVRNNTSTGNAIVKVVGTSAADIVNYQAAPVGGIGAMISGTNRPIRYNDKVYAVEYFSNGGNDIIDATPGSTNIFGANATGTTSTQVFLKVNGTAGADTVSANPTPSPTGEAIVVGSLKPVFFNPQIYAVEYYTGGGADTVSVKPSVNTMLSIIKNGAATGNVVVTVTGTSASETVNFVVDPLSASSAMVVSGQKTVFFTNSVYVVEYYGGGGSDIVDVQVSTTTIFSVIDASNLIVHGSSANDTVTLLRPNPDLGGVVFHTGSYQTVFFKNISTEVKVDLGNGNDTLWVDLVGEPKKYTLLGGLGDDTLIYSSGSSANVLYQDFEH